MRELWRNPWVRLATAILVLFALGWLARALSNILFPLVLALVFAYIFDPVVDFFENRKIPRAGGIGLLLLFGMVLLAGIPLYIIPNLAGEVAELSDSVREHLPGWQDRIEELTIQYEDNALVIAGRERAQEAIEWTRSKVPDLLAAAQRVALSTLRGTLDFVSVVTNFILFSIVAIYLLYDFDNLVAHIREFVPHPYRARTFDVAKRIDDNVRNFYRGQISVCSILTVIYTAGLLFFDVPFAPLLGIIGGFGQLIPYIGTLLGAIPAVILAGVEHQALWNVGGAAFTFVAGQMLEGTVITPKIVGDKVGLHPVAVILALMIFTKALGFVGLLLAVPLAAALKVLLGDLAAEYKRTGLYRGPDPDESAPTPAHEYTP